MSGFLTDKEVLDAVLSCTTMDQLSAVYTKYNFFTIVGPVKPLAQASQSFQSRYEAIVNKELLDQDLYVEGSEVHSAILNNLAAAKSTAKLSALWDDPTSIPFKRKQYSNLESYRATHADTMRNIARHLAQETGYTLSVNDTATLLDTGKSIAILQAVKSVKASSKPRAAESAALTIQDAMDHFDLHFDEEGWSVERFEDSKEAP